MWKYVGHRLKDSAELTCTHFKNLRSTFCTCDAKTTTKNIPKQDVIRRFEKWNNRRVYNVWGGLDSANKEPKKQNKEVIEATVDIDTTYLITKYNQNQKQKQQQQSFNRCFDVNFLQWTAGILCSFYFGKWMCFYARHRQNVKRWHHMEQVLSDRTLQQTLRKFNQSQHQRSWVPSNDVHWYDADQMRGIRALLPLVPVSNDHLNPNGHDTSSPIISAATAATQTTRKRTDVSIAVDNLVSTLGSIEFRLGMQNLRANEPEMAVSHLKLATTHRHPGATFNLGICYETGTGVEKNMKNAMECYRAAASLGHKKAMYNLGIFYVHGRGGLKKNMEAARACFEAAEKLGLRTAKSLLRLPEKPIEQDNEIVWKTIDLIGKKLSPVDERDKTSVI